MSPEEYLDMIKPYLRNMIHDHKTPMNLRVYLDNEVINHETQFGEWNIQLTMLTNFISSKDPNNETRIICTKSDNIEIMISSETDEIIEELFKSLLQRFQKGSEKLQRGSEFVYNSVNLLHYQLQKTSLKRIGSSHIDSPKWLKNKKATINPKNSDNKCFQYALTSALNHKQIKNHAERISILKLLLISITGKKKIFQHKTGKSSN